MPRILFIGPGQSPGFRERVAPFLGEEGASLVSTEPLPPAFRDQHPQLDVRQLPRPTIRRPALRAVDYVAGLNALIRASRPDLIHLHGVSRLDGLALLPVRRTPIILGADGLEDLPRAARPLFRRAAAVTAPTRYLARRCEDLGTPASRVHRILWGVDTELFRARQGAAARRRLGLPPNGTLLLCPSSSGHRALVRAVADLNREQDRAIRLVFPGGVHGSELQALCDRVGVPAHFLAPCPDQDRPDLYAATDACASLHASDGLPGPLLEALACERPVVSLDLVASEELPFAADAVQRVPHDAGVPRMGHLVTAVQGVLDRVERPGLETARDWIERNAELERSVANVRAIYLALAPRE